jgi:hypothetical protein
MNSDYSTLSELAYRQGITHADLFSSVSKAVLEDFHLHYPQSSMTAEMYINESTGDIRIFDQHVDVTPEGYAIVAGTIAKQTIMARLSAKALPSTAVQHSETTTPVSGSGILAIIENLFFWGYNLYFMLFLFFFLFSVRSMLVPSALVETLKTLGVFRILLFLTVFLTPIGSMITSIKQKLYDKPSSLFRLFFMLEVPLVTACTIPLMILPQAIPFVQFIVILAISLPAILYVTRNRIPGMGIGLRIMYFFEHASFFVSLYLLTLYSFYLPLILGGIAKMFFGGTVGNYYSQPMGMGGDLMYKQTYSILQPSDLIGMFFQFGISLFFFLLLTSVTFSPYMILIGLWKALKQTRLELMESFSKHMLSRLDLAYMAGVFVLCVALSYQNVNHPDLIQLKEVSNAKTFEEKERLAKDLIPKEDTLRQQIIDQQNNGSRYLFQKNGQGLVDGYKQIYSIDTPVIQVAQAFFTMIAYPFVYQGDYDPSNTLETAFRYVFGLYPGNSKTVWNTSSSVGLVLLTNRTTTVIPEEQGLLSTISVEEEYENTTYQLQEVVYEFSLPQGSVVTDLRLGPDLEFIGQIAPRGAAERTYELQQQQRRDPALLEQTGPHQYRLRVFPIPEKGSRHLKVRYTYIAPATPEGYMLPVVTRSTGVYQNGTTHLTGRTPTTFLALKSSDRFIPLQPGNTQNLCGNIVSTRSPLSIHSSNPITRLGSCGTDADVISHIQNARIAIYLSVSAPKGTTDSARESMAFFKHYPPFLANNSIDLYKYNELMSTAVPVTAETIDGLLTVHRFGTNAGLSPITLPTKQYDIVFIVTDKQPEPKDLLPFHAPTTVFFVMPGAPPAFSMRLTSQLLQRHGEVVESIIDGLRLYTLANDKQMQNITNEFIINRYLSISDVPPLGAVNQPPLKAETPLTALNQMKNLAMLRRGIANYTYDLSPDLSTLDRFNAFSTASHQVSPYSSYLALVNTLQQQQLAQQSGQSNRYQETERSQGIIIDQPMGMQIRNFSGALGGILPIFGSGVEFQSMDLQRPFGESRGSNLMIASPNNAKAASIPSLFTFSGLGIVILLSLLPVLIGAIIYFARFLKRK